jgi:two-component system, LytTR family, response regulator
MIRGVIIEDEPLHRGVIKRNLLAFCPDVKIVAEIESGAEAVKVLPGLKFDILFMDIELGDMDAFEILRSLPESDLHIIFVTSHDKYAMKAFEVHAVDYLLKPVDGAKLVKSVEKAMLQIISSEKRYEIGSDYSISKNNRLLISSNNEYKLVDIDKVVYCKADGNYTDVNFIDVHGAYTKITDAHNLKNYDEKLKHYGFIRIHQSFLVNKTYVTRIRKNPCEVILSNDVALPVARERKQEVLEFFGC